MRSDIINIATLFILAGFVLHLIFLFRIIKEINNSKKYSKDKINYISVLFPFNLNKIMSRHKEVYPDSDLPKRFRMNNIVITIAMAVTFIYIMMN